MAKKPAKKQSSKKSSSASKPSADRIIDAALAATVDVGWAHLDMRVIAAEAKLPLSDVRGLFSSKSAILAAYMQRVDIAVLKGAEADKSLENESFRDRLFDILMRRIDTLSPHKAALTVIARDAARDPASLIFTLPQAERSITWMLAGAGVAPRGLPGAMMVKAVGLAWLATLRTWFRDDDPDLSRTMAALDRHLGRLAQLAKLTGCGAKNA